MLIYFEMISENMNINFKVFGKKEGNVLIFPDKSTPNTMINVTIGDNVVIGAGSVVSRSVPSNSVAVGNPAKVISSIEDYVNKRKKQMITFPCYDESYKITVITPERKLKMIEEVDSIGFIE